jgi:hypothetical protein
MLAAAGRINENGSVSTNANTGAAKWISPSAFVVSSLETGRIGYIVAWGGNEYGYAYKLRPCRGPRRSDHRFGYGDRPGDCPGPGNLFLLRPGVQSGIRRDCELSLHPPSTRGHHERDAPTAAQILHKTYDPHSGAWGTPRRNDWTAVFSAMAAQIISDQTAANAVGDEKLRAFIPLHRGSSMTSPTTCG